LPQDFARPAEQLSTQNRLKKGDGEGRRVRMPAIFVAGGVLLLLLVVMLTGEGDQVDASVPEFQEEWLESELALADANGGSHERKVTLQPGDAAATALIKLDFDFPDIARMEEACKPVHKLSDVRAGNMFKRIDRQDGPHIYYHIDALQRLHLHLPAGSDAWQAEVEARDYEARQRVVSGTIEESLFVAAARAGMDERTTMNMVDIFAWDIDFARDLRNGDRFTVYYEERFDDQGRQIGTGRAPSGGRRA